MSKLIEKMKKEAERLKKKEAERGDFGPKIDWYNPEVGEHMIRVLSKSDDVPWRQVRIHYIGIKKKDGSGARIPVRCLEDFDETCPVCQAYEKMRKSDNEKAKDLRAIERYIYLIIDYTSKTVKPWLAGVKVHTSIVEFFGDLAETAFERDWKLTKKRDPRKPKHLGIDYSIRPAMKETEIPAKLQPLVDEAIDIETLFGTNEKKKMLEFLGMESDEDVDTDGADADEEAEIARAAKAKAAAAKAKAAAKKPVDDDDDDDRSAAFDDEEEDDIPENKPAKKSASAKPAAKKKVEDDEDEDLDIDAEDEDLEEELRSLGVE